MNLLNIMQKIEPTKLLKSLVRVAYMVSIPHRVVEVEDREEEL
jgi:hypothetical protein